MHNPKPPNPKVKVTSLTQWLEAVTLRIECPGLIISPTMIGPIYYSST